MSELEKRIVSNTQKNIQKRESRPSPVETANPQIRGRLSESVQMEAAKVSDAQASSARITDLEKTLGPLPDSRAQNTAKINEVKINRQRELILGEVFLNEKRIMGYLKEIDDTFARMGRSIEDDAYSSQSMLKIGRVLEERSNFGEIKRQAELFIERFSFLSEANDTEEKMAVVRENQETIRSLAVKGDELYQFLSRLQRQTSDYYDGRNNEDEDLLRRLQQQLDVAFETLKQVSALHQNEESMLADYQKMFPI